jgi:hypothetical protein
MEKYLFTDGTNVVREVRSKESLQQLIQGAGDPTRIRIWIFHSSEWISVSEFAIRESSRPPIVEKNGKARPVARAVALPAKAKTRSSAGLVKLFILIITAATILLVYNFSRVKWHTASSLQITAARPSNSPLVDLDSLVRVIEWDRGKPLDKVTLTNLRIRNSWPDRVELRLKTERDTSQAGTKYHSMELSIDNSTGYHIDQAVVEINEWRNSQVYTTDTFHIDNIGYSNITTRPLANEYTGDSLSVSFLAIRSKAFNFCYSAEKESNYGNLNDRWFCRE